MKYLVMVAILAALSPFILPALLVTYGEVKLVQVITHAPSPDNWCAAHPQFSHRVNSKSYGCP